MFGIHKWKVWEVYQAHEVLNIMGSGSGIIYVTQKRFCEHFGKLQLRRAKNL